MNDMKTTIAGAVGGVANLLVAYGYKPSVELQDLVISAALLISGYLAKDSTK